MTVTFQRRLPAEIEYTEVTNFGSAEPEFIMTSQGDVVSPPDWTEWCIRQSRASYLAGTIFWWQLEDEIWDALNGRFPRRLGIAPSHPNPTKVSRY